ncbi:MAG TPA: hypothetical protein VLQ67_15430 [Arachnia sp.]|nr:hypothetical protein [Arachnia sp.]
MASDEEALAERIGPHTDHHDAMEAGAANIRKAATGSSKLVPSLDKFRAGGRVESVAMVMVVRS